MNKHRNAPSVLSQATEPFDFSEENRPDPDYGLHDQIVRLRREEGYDNFAVGSPTKTAGQIILGNIFTYFNLIFAVIAVALIIVGSSWANLTFLIAVVCNTLIGIVQELRSKRTLDRLTLLHAPTAEVVREGEVRSVLPEELVLGDIVQLSAGEQVCADAVVMQGEIQVNESLVTGESDEITKRVGDELRSGSFVVSGTCRCCLTAVGADSYVSKLTIDAKKGKKKKEIGMVRSLNRLILVIGILLIPIGAGLVFRYLWDTDYSMTAWRGAVESSAAALIGMIPEGLYLLVSVALAVSVIRLAKKQTLCHDLKCIETLARVDVLCVDKTGTVTDSDMKVTDLLLLPDCKKTSDEVREAFTSLAGTVDGGNDTMKAICREFGMEDFVPCSQVIPFTSTTKYTGFTVQGEHYVLGAPEFLLRERYTEYQAAILPFAKNGSRVLLLGTVSELRGGLLTDKVTPLALLLLENPVRENAYETFSYFTEQGVTVKVISGDNPLTASAAAEKAGIPNAENYLDATVLTTYKEAAEAVEKYTVFGRVTPHQKKWFVQALKKNGHTVAMTGDGINDVLALKEADCSVAMASGSDVATQVAQLVLLDNDFSHMPDVVAEGRRVINNIERSASLFLVKNIFSFFLALITIGASFAYPLKPVHLTLINIFTIGIPSFFLALEPSTNRIRGRFLPSVLYRAAPCGITNVIIVTFVILYREIFGLAFDQVASVCAVLVGFVGIMMLFRVCRPFNRFRKCLWTVMTVGLAASCVLFSLFSKNVILAKLDMKSLLILLTFLLMAYPVMKVSASFFVWCGQKYRKGVESLKRTVNRL